MLDFPIKDIGSSTLGIIGYGTLGRAVAKLAAACGMRVLVATQNGRDGEARPHPFQRTA
ncbi:MAG: NAD(P)-dependent oxidoreductase [Pyrinomonadaceae bacterium]